MASFSSERLQGGEATITASYPAGVGGDTLAHLKAEAAGERHEWTTLYTGFAEEAIQEGFQSVAETFKQVAAVEQWHERRYNKLVEAVQNKIVFKKPRKVLWKRRECGGTPCYAAPQCRFPAGTEKFANDQGLEGQQREVTAR